jgi:hypothetical protein
VLPRAAFAVLAGDKSSPLLTLFTKRRRPMTEWISVKERTPERMQKVLTYHKRGKIRLHYWIEADREDFTHWMPLPEPPKD